MVALLQKVCSFSFNFRIGTALLCSPGHYFAAFLYSRESKGRTGLDAATATAAFRLRGTGCFTDNRENRRISLAIVD